ncbi:MAG: hypothetical protein ACM3ML_04095 [Micromonosporaceae bacterium]
MGADAVLGQLQGAIPKAEAFPGEFTAKINGILDKVDSLLSDVPGWLQSMISWIVDEAKKLWQQIKDLSAKLLDWLDKNVWPVIRGPFTLWDASNQWTTAVYHPATTVSGDTNTAKTTVDDWWQGAAATAYGQMIPVQKAASDKIAEIASKVKDTLQALCFSLGALYIAIVLLLVGLLLQIDAVAAAIASVVGIPAGLIGAVATILEAIAGVAAVYAGVNALATNALGSFNTLLQLQNDNSAFENGHWPKDAAALGEIGNGSDWHFKG